MTELHKQINASKLISDNDKYYWGYMYGLGAETIVPYISELGAFKNNDAVAEIGSAEGGVLAAFVEKGAKSALGTDISLPRLETGKQIAKEGNLEIEFTSHDIINEEPAKEWLNNYNLVLLRDVIEHLDDTTIALANIKKIIKPGGYLFVTFPPYYSPFGGHQHTIGHKRGMFPYIHLLPNKMFYWFLKKGRQNDIGEVKRLQNIKLTAKKFLKSVEDAGYEVAHYDYYLLRPVFKWKFGLPTLKLTPISWLPLVKSVLSLEACYLLKVPD
jgi:SAM-dependent methyltransferase